MDAACGGDHSAAVTEDGALYTWGTGAFMHQESQEPNVYAAYRREDV
jgi:alpha-tubulin suppressor-like RCC1 family protein